MAPDEYEDLNLDSIENAPAIDPSSVSSDEETAMLKAGFAAHSGAVGNFMLRNLLGQGGMGAVWLATDTQLERQVALKLMRPEYISNQEAIRRFQREARAIAKLNHPNIVQVYTIGQHENTVYMAIELVEGDPLSTILAHRGTMSLFDATSVILQTVEGLAYACSRGVVHRDIKPGNIMLTTSGIVKITDFGLAKLMQSDTAMTQEGTTLGSPNYMSPEQAKGLQIDHRSDIYSLGITFFQLLTGGVPFKAETPLSVMLMHIQDPLPEPQDLSGIANGEALRIIKKMTAKNVADRYQDYASLAGDLVKMVPNANTCVVPASVHKSQGTTPPVEIKTATSSQKLGNLLPAIGVGFAAVLVIIIGGFWVLVHNRGENTASTPADTKTAIATPPPANTPQTPAPTATTAPATPAATATPTPPLPTPVQTQIAMQTPIPTVRPTIVYTPIQALAEKKTIAITAPQLNEKFVPSFLDKSFKRVWKNIPVGTELEVIESNTGYILAIDPKDKKTRIYLFKQNVKF